MLTKGLLLLLATIGALWWFGVDLHDVRERVMGVSSENARSLTGRDEDWD